MSSILVNPQHCVFIILMAARNRAELHSVALSLNYRNVTQLCGHVGKFLKILSIFFILSVHSSNAKEEIMRQLEIF